MLYSYYTHTRTHTHTCFTSAVYTSTKAPGLVFEGLLYNNHDMIIYIDRDIGIDIDIEMLYSYFAHTHTRTQHTHTHMLYF
jgi:hypothetical protein